MKLLLIAILMAILSISGFSQPETLFGSPEVTSAAGRNTTVSVDNTNTVRINQGGTVITSGSVNQGGTVTTSGYVKQGGTVETYGNVNQGGTVTTIGHVNQGGNVNVSGTVKHVWVNNPQPASTKTRTIYRTRNIVAPAPPVTVNNYNPPQEKLVAPVYNIYTTTPMDAGTAGKEKSNMIDPGMVWLAFIAGAIIISVIAIIFNAAQKAEEQKTKQEAEKSKQKFAEQKQAFTEKLMANTDSDVSGGLSESFVTIDKKLKTVATGTVPLATPVAVTYPAVNPWQGYINGQPNNQQPNPGGVQVQPGSTPISSINTTITYATNP